MIQIWIPIRIRILFRILHEFLNRAFLLGNCQISYFSFSLTSDSFRIRSAQFWNDFFLIRIRIRILLKVSAPTGSGYRNTASF
jgi:hypothetical protein